MNKSLFSFLTMCVLLILPISKSFSEISPVSPLQQWKQGATPIEISCSDGRFLMINPNNEKPACLFPSKSMIRFAENGWIPIRNLLLDNPIETTISGHGSDFAKRYFSYFEINDENSILLHSINDKTLVNMMYSGEKIISNCVNTGGSSEVTISTLVEINLKESTIILTQEKQTWSEGFCGDDESILNAYYARFFS